MSNRGGRRLWCKSAVARSYTAYAKLSSIQEWRIDHWGDCTNGCAFSTQHDLTNRYIGYLGKRAVTEAQALCRGSISPTQRKINALRADLTSLEQKHKRQKICRVASQGALTQSNIRDQSFMPQYRKRGSQVSLSNCTDILCFLEDYGVFVCKQHHTAVVNLDKHLSQYHNVPASTRRQVVDCFSRLTPLAPAEIKLQDEPVQAIEELGKPLTRLQCKTCGYITINIDQTRMHCKRYYQQA